MEKEGILKLCVILALFEIQIVTRICMCMLHINILVKPHCLHSPQKGNRRQKLVSPKRSLPTASQRKLVFTTSISFACDRPREAIIDRNNFAARKEHPLAAPQDGGTHWGLYYL